MGQRPADAGLSLPACLVYLVHGAPSYYQEAAYSLLSLWRQSGGPALRIVIVTDDPQPMRGLLGDTPQLEFLVFSAQQRREWTGADGYIHRMKPSAFAWALQQLASEGDGEAIFAFVDSDTSFMRSPDVWLNAVADGAVVLHAQEGTVAGNRGHSRSQRRLADGLASQHLSIRGQNRWVSGDSVMWNSGVIGLRASQRDILTETIDLIDSLYPLITIHTVEQVALSLVLQDRAQRVITCDDTVLHYHTFKEFRGDLARFFRQYPGASQDELMQACPLIDPAQRIVPKRTFNDSPKWQRKLKKYLGLGWKPLPLPWPEP